MRCCEQYKTETRSARQEYQLVSRFLRLPFSIQFKLTHLRDYCTRNKPFSSYSTKATCLRVFMIIGIEGLGYRRLSLPLLLLLLLDQTSPSLSLLTLEHHFVRFCTIPHWFWTRTLDRRQHKHRSTCNTTFSCDFAVISFHFLFSAIYKITSLSQRWRAQTQSGIQRTVT